MDDDFVESLPRYPNSDESETPTRPQPDSWTHLAAGVLLLKLVVLAFWMFHPCFGGFALVCASLAILLFAVSILIHEGRTDEHD
jgi:hypothetical protein